MPKYALFKFNEFLLRVLAVETRVWGFAFWRNSVFIVSLCGMLTVPQKCHEARTKRDITWVSGAGSVHRE